MSTVAVLFLIFPNDCNVSNLWICRTNIYPHLTYKDTKAIPRSKAICPRSQIKFRSPGLAFLLVLGPICPLARLECKRSVFMDARTAGICGVRHGEEKNKEKDPWACALRTPLSSLLNSKFCMYMTRLQMSRTQQLFAV